jgi:hypothetical protein
LILDLAEFGAKAAAAMLDGSCLSVVENPFAALRIEVKKP